MDIIKQLSTELELDKSAVEAAVELFDKGNSLHFIARYRRDKTQGMEADKLRELEKRYQFLTNLQDAKYKAIEQLQEQDQLSDQLRDAIQQAETLSDVKEIMSPYRSKRKTRASKARDAGLQPAADIILGKSKGDILEVLPKSDSEEVELEQALDIVAEEAINHPQCKRVVEQHIYSRPIKIRYDSDKDEEGTYRDLEELSGTKQVKQLSPHQIHALFRAEEEGIVSFSFDIKVDRIIDDVEKASKFYPPNQYRNLFKKGLEDGTNRLLKGRAQRSVLSDLKEKADERAIEVFKQNLFDLLLQPGVDPRVILGLDPGFRSGSKYAIVDPTHKVLATGTIYPNPPQNEVDKSAKTIQSLIKQFDVDFIAVGNGTASVETLEFVKYTLSEYGLAKVNYAMIPETGASVYSASEIANQEFPDLPTPIRGAISIARRVLDPLAEYVKIDPQSLGVGQYQHSIDKKSLDEALDFIVDKAVNTVGVNLQTASQALLEHVAGLTSATAQAIVEARNNGELFERDDLLRVNGIGMVTYEQAIGFLRMYSSENPLDQTLIHPDHYGIARAIVESKGKNVYNWKQLSEGQRRSLLKDIDPSQYTTEFVGTEVVEDIITELVEYGKDPRGKKEFVDRSNQPQDISELKEGMTLNGEISNVVDFGAFVDLGLKDNGLIHISNLADRYVSNVRAIVKVGDQVKVEILSVDTDRKRIGLRLIEVNGKLP